ncbi:MAG: ATP-binding cassette domain-containing protein [Lachnospiraceae bacterium]|nr:ATP-binding cassette domain-containing protein [Lachnospiraceae bacterium]
MIRILKFAKKSWYWIVCIFILLVIQAACDLSLPQYTSDIVDVGIQNSGIEESIPKAMTESTYEELKLFLKEGNELDSFYNYINRNEISQEEKREYEEKYPEFKSQNIYLLNFDIKKEPEKEQKVHEIIKTAAALHVMLFSEDFQSEESRDAINMDDFKKQMATMMQNTEIQQMEMKELLPMLPKEVISQLVESVEEKLKDMEGLIGESVSTSFVKSSYEALGMDMDEIQINYLVTVGVKMLLLALLGMVAAITVTLLASRVAAVTSKDLRNKSFEKVVGFSAAEMNHFSTASLITRCTNDIQQIQMVTVMILRIVIYAPILGIGGLIKVFNTTQSMAWIIGVAVLAIICLVAVLMAVAMPKFKMMQVLVDKLNLVSREMLTGIPVIRAFSREKHEEERFDQANKNLMKTQLFTNRAMALMMPTMMFVMNGITVLILWIGANGIDLGNLQVGDMMAFITYTMQIVMAFLMITMVSVMLPRAAVAAGRVDEVLNSETLIKNPEIERTPKAEETTLEFNDVSFKYPEAEENVLSNISFTARAGETTAIIGSTGSGKSTLVNLVPRLYDVTEGNIQINGVNIKDMNLKKLRHMIGFVPQKGILFSGTIDSNLRFGAKKANEETIEEAATTAQAMEFINEKPGKFESPISQGGANVSGGQKQRLAIARAIAKKPKIYIFDDSFSALDYKTDVAVRKALQDKVKNDVMIIVAQRISTILHAEKIIVLDEGKMVGMGTHEELLKDNEVYRQIAMSQLSEKELGINGEGKEEA